MVVTWMPTDLRFNTYSGAGAQPGRAFAPPKIFKTLHSNFDM